MYGIIELRWRELARVEANGQQVPSNSGVRHDAADREVRDVRLDGQGRVRLEVLEDGSGDERLLQLDEGCFRFQGPGEPDR